MEPSAAPAPRSACKRAGCAAVRLLAVLLLLSAAATGATALGTFRTPALAVAAPTHGPAYNRARSPLRSLAQR